MTCRFTLPALTTMLVAARLRGRQSTGTSTMADDEKIVTEKAGAPTGRTSRRQALGVMGTAVSAGVVGATMPASAQAPAAPVLRTPTPPPVVVPRTELVNVLEYEPQARLVIGAAKLAPVTGSDRTVTDRITLRPRMNI